MINFKDKKTWHHLKNWFFIGLGSIIIALSTGYFLVPGNIVNGGLAGIAIVLHSLWLIPIDLTVAVLSVLLFIVGFFTLGKQFSINTLISTIVYPLALTIILRLSPQNPIGFDFSNDMHLFLASIFGGATLGFGVALTFLFGGSTGGVDIIYFMMKKYFDIRQSITAFVIDALIIVSGMFVFGIIFGLYGVISAFITAFIIEIVFIGLSTSLLGTIVSKEAHKINDFILYKMERGSTIVPAQGGHSGHPYQMIQVAFDRKELNSLREFIAEVDPQAFAIFTNVKSINGYGFEPFPRKVTKLFFKKRRKNE